MKKQFIFSLGILFSITVLMANTSIQAQPKHTPSIKQEEVDLTVFQNLEVLRLAVAELSKDLPKNIDKYTTLVDVTSEDLTLIYVYEINTGDKSDKSVKEEDHDRMRHAVTYGTCQTSKRFLDSGISISYLYNSATSKAKLFQFFISKKDCSSF